MDSRVSEEVFELYAEELPREADLGLPQCIIVPPQCVIACYPPDTGICTVPPIDWGCMPQCVIG